MQEIKKQYDLPKGARIMMRDTDANNFIKLKFRGMDGAYGRWELAGEILVGNYYGKFHWNNSQKYWYYEPSEDE